MKTKNKRVLRFSLAGAALIAVSAALVFVNKGQVFSLTRGADHDANCNWNHYTEVAATYESHGSKEFWACCSHPGQFVLTAPAEGHITDMGAFSGEYFDNLASNDDRFIPQLEGGNKFARLDIIGWQDPALLYSVNTYQNVQTVTAKIRVTGGEYNSWMGIGVTATHSDWDFTQLSTAYDGEWHMVTVNIGGADGYVNFCYNLDHVQAGYIDVDDITIVTTTDVYFESFESNTRFELDANHARIAQEAPGNKILRENSIEIDNEQCMVHSAKQYTGVTNVSWKMRIPSGCGAWGGVAVNESLSIYNNTNQQYTADGAWHAYSKDFASLDGYVEFCHEQGHFTGPIDYDDIIITYDGGKTAIETFDGASVMKVRSAGKAKIITEPREGEIGVVALDAQKTTVENREYSPSFDISKGVDPTYGSYVQIDNWTCAASENRLWIGMTATEPLALVQTKLGQEIKSYYFYMYNPTDADFIIMLMLDHHYSNVSAATLVAKSWTKVEMQVGTYGSYTLTEAAQIGFDKTMSESGASLGSGWKISSIYAKGLTNYYLRLYSSTYSSGTASANSKVTYDSITSVSFDYRLTGGPQEGKGAWWGIGIAANHDIYTGMHTTSSAAWDGEWHHKTYTINEESGYVNLVHACGEQLEGSTIDFDNIVITYDGGKTATEDFLGGWTTFEFYASHPERVELIEQ